MVNTVWIRRSVSSAAPNIVRQDVLVAGTFRIFANLMASVKKKRHIAGDELTLGTKVPESSTHISLRVVKAPAKIVGRQP